MVPQIPQIGEKESLIFFSNYGFFHKSHGPGGRGLQFFQPKNRSVLNHSEWLETLFKQVIENYGNNMTSLTKL